MTQKTTYCTLIKNIPPHQDRRLSDYASLMGRVERKLFAAMHKTGFNRNEAKQVFIKQYGISARQFNSVRMMLDGKVLSRKEALKLQKKTLEHKQELVKKTVEAIKNKYDMLSKTGGCDKAIHKQAFKLHQKKRLLQSLSHRIKSVETKLARPIAPLCFGGRKRQNKQHHLQKNYYIDHDAWLTEWQRARANDITLVGSKDEAWGNQSARLIPNEDGSYSLHLRLPDALGGGFEVFTGIRFDYGNDVIAKATESNQLRQRKSTKAELAKLEAQYTGTNPPTKNNFLSPYGQGLTIKLTRHKFGWRLAVTVEETSNHTDFVEFDNGALGVDVNADHLALSVIDKQGNCIHSESYPIDLSTQYATSHTRAAAIGEAGKYIVELAKRYGVGIAHENLDFNVKKSALKESGHKRYRVMLSILSYQRVLNAIIRRAFRHGVHTQGVDPKLTSVMGVLKYQHSNITSHEAAAIVIARRGCGLIKERLRFIFTTNNPSIQDALLATVSMPLDPFNRWMKMKRLTSVPLKRHAKLLDTNVSVKVTASKVALAA